VLGKLRLQSLVEIPDGVAAHLTASVHQATAPLATKAATAPQERRRAEEMTPPARPRGPKRAQRPPEGFPLDLQKHSRHVLEVIVRGGPELEELRRTAAAKLVSQRTPQPQRGRDRGLGR
jgi:hypothetical protein